MGLGLGNCKIFGVLTMKVFVYRNLHRQCYSVKALEGPDKGRVVAWVDEIYLAGAVFKVSQAGRARVIREQSKNVHAGVVGEWVRNTVVARERVAGYDNTLRKAWVTYNPYKFSSFVFRDDLAPVASATMAHVNPNGIAVWGGA